MNYNLIDAKWGPTSYGQPSGQVTWAADLSSGLSYDTSLYSQADFEAALAAAFKAWEDVASVDFVQTTNLAGAMIVVDMGALAGSVVGQAQITTATLSGLDRILDVDITLDSTELWSPYGSTGTDFYAVATHEIGHAIGLDHVNDPNEIMNPVISTNKLGVGDITGAQLLYGADPGDVSVGASPSPLATGGGGGGGGGSGGGIAVMLGAILALLAGLLGGGAGAAVTMAAGHKPDDDDDQSDYGDPIGNDLIAFLDNAFGAAEIQQEVHQLHLEEGVLEEGAYGYA